MTGPVRAVALALKAKTLSLMNCWTVFQRFTAELLGRPNRSIIAQIIDFYPVFSLNYKEKQYWLRAGLLLSLKNVGKNARMDKQPSQERRWHLSHIPKGSREQPENETIQQSRVDEPDAIQRTRTAD